MSGTDANASWLLQALESNANDYQYLKAVQFVKKVKKGPLQETSPLLNDISGVPTWEKVGIQVNIGTKYMLSPPCPLELSVSDLRPKLGLNDAGNSICWSADCAVCRPP